MLWKCKVPDMLHLASYLIGLGEPELQDKQNLTYIVGDLVMQQQILYFLCDGFECTFKNKKMRKLNICATQ